MHFVNPTTTKRFKALDKWLQLTLWGLAVAFIGFMLVVGGVVVLRFEDHDLRIPFDFFHASESNPETPLSAYLQLAFLMFVAGNIVYGIVILMFTRWRQQAELDTHHASLRKQAKKLFKLAAKPEATMTTLHWRIMLDKVVHQDKKAVRIQFVRTQKGGRTFPLPTEYTLYLYKDGSTMKRGYLSSIRLYRLETLLVYVERLYDDRHQGVSKTSRA